MASDNRIPPPGYDRSMLLVIPSVLEKHGDTIRFDRDFSNNLEAYLRAFDSVTVACPPAYGNSGFPGTRTPAEIPGGDRIRVIALPQPYREDRYFRRKAEVGRLLAEEIDKARYLLISPHAPFDWSTLAAEICIRKHRKYNMEADWNLPATSHYIWSRMPFGPNKLRKRLWLAYHNPKYWRCLRHSSLALLQGEDVYNEYRTIAPNPHAVLNVQITDDEKIPQDALEAKIRRAREGGPIRLVYAGRAIEMKGPLHWLGVLDLLKQRGIAFDATWFGTGELFGQMQAFVKERGLEGHCRLAGSATRDVVFAAMRQADAFLFCHMGKESPRCLVEALASAAPLIGFGSDYSRSLVRDRGGGDFVECGDTAGLARLVETYATDRDRLATLIRNAAASAALLDREKAIAERIRLMKEYL